MRAAIYSPYLDTLGGGERYVLSFAKVLKDAGWSVEVESSDGSILARCTERFGLNLDNLRVVKSVNRGSGYDLCFWLSDGSIPTLFARKNILHFQRPFFNVDGKSLINRMKFFRINKVIVNSKFTKKWIDKEYPFQSIVIYPPVDVSKFKPKKKENLILYVGRFSRLEQAKRQDILLRAFKKFYDSGYKDWKLVLAGGSDVGKDDFVDKLKSNAEGYPIKILENATFGEIKDLYGRSKLFWSAAGYGANSEKEPNRVEHFGITIVEAMAAGCVPIVFGAGGHKEVTKDSINGYLWDTTSQLISKTRLAIDDRKTFVKVVKQARKDAERYSYARFEKEVLKII